MVVKIVFRFVVAPFHNFYKAVSHKDNSVYLMTDHVTDTPSPHALTCLEESEATQLESPHDATCCFGAQPICGKKIRHFYLPIIHLLMNDADVQNVANLFAFVLYISGTGPAFVQSSVRFVAER